MPSAQQLRLMAYNAKYTLRKVLECRCGTEWVTEYEKPTSVFPAGSVMDTFSCVCGLTIPLYNARIVSCAECRP